MLWKKGPGTGKKPRVRTQDHGGIGGIGGAREHMAKKSLRRRGRGEFDLVVF
jgi:hypothetical protein